MTQEANLTAIADAIRAKEGSTDPIPASAFAQRIAALETGDSSKIAFAAKSGSSGTVSFPATVLYARAGMTWAEWCGSEYNTVGWFIDGEEVVVVRSGSGSGMSELCVYTLDGEDYEGPEDVIEEAVYGIGP